MLFRFLINRRSAAACVVAFAAAQELFPATSSELTSCRPIQFQKGASSADIRGEASPDGASCLQFGTGANQAVLLSVKSPHDQVAFSIRGLVDDRQQYSFTSEKKTYEVLLFQSMKSTATVGYTLTLSIH